MYTILINPDNTLTHSIKEKIMHRESNVHTFRFLVDPIWVDYGVETEMRNYTCLLEYRTPISEKYTPVILTPSTDLYRDMLEYTAPITTDFTAEIGSLELKFIFTWLEMDSDGKFIEHSRKTSSTAVTIIPVEQWSDYCASSDLDNIVQAILAQQAQNAQSLAINEQMYMYAQQIANTKYGLSYDKDNNELHLEKNGQVNSTVTLEENCRCEDGVPVVDFNVIEPEAPDDEFDNVVEF